MSAIAQADEIELTLELICKLRKQHRDLAEALQALYDHLATKSGKTECEEVDNGHRATD